MPFTRLSRPLRALGRPEGLEEAVLSSATQYNIEWSADAIRQYPLS
jgi:hypothetical protein